jgi:hypothetical protein
MMNYYIRYFRDYFDTSEGYNYSMLIENLDKFTIRVIDLSRIIGADYAPSKGFPEQVIGQSILDLEELPQCFNKLIAATKSIISRLIPRDYMGMAPTRVSQEEGTREICNRLLLIVYVCKNMLLAEHLHDVYGEMDGRLFEALEKVNMRMCLKPLSDYAEELLARSISSGKWEVDKPYVTWVK